MLWPHKATCTVFFLVPRVRFFLPFLREPAHPSCPGDEDLPGMRTGSKSMELVAGMVWLILYTFGLLNCHVYNIAKATLADCNLFVKKNLQKILIIV